jgi:transposase
MHSLPVDLPIDEQTSVRSELLRGPERRRRWSAEEKARIVAESLGPGAVARQVALRHGLHPHQLYAWRHTMRLDAAGPVDFAPVVVAPVGQAGSAAIEIVLGDAVMRVAPGADIGLIGEIVRLLRRPG